MRLVLSCIVFIHRDHRDELLGRYPQAYNFLLKMAVAHAKFQILPFDEEDLAVFNALPHETRSIGKVDRLIAATAMRHKYIVVTMNKKKDFDRIPGCRSVDWSRPES